MLKKVFIIPLVIFPFFIPLSADASDIQIPQTGQSGCYDSNSAIYCAGSGQDGAILAGKPWPLPRFVYNNNATVTDRLTGLIWLYYANCTDTVGGISKSSGTLTWADALTWTKSLANGLCGLTDGSTAGQWRLPNRKELASLTIIDRHDWLNETGAFYNVQGIYWSSNTHIINTTNAWIVGIRGGSIFPDNKSNQWYVWPVRDAQ